MICGGGRDTNTCKGDSGGPLIANIDGKFTLVGVTSWGPSGCGGSNNIGVYTDISEKSMMRFINNISTPGPMCQPNSGTITQQLTFEYDQYDSNASISSRPRSNGNRSGNRVFGGKNATPGEVPWQVNLLLDGTQLSNLECGGTLVSLTVRFMPS